MPRPLGFDGQQWAGSALPKARGRFRAGFAERSVAVDA